MNEKRFLVTKGVRLAIAMLALLMALAALALAMALAAAASLGLSPAHAMPQCDVPNPPPICSDDDPGGGGTGGGGGGTGGGGGGTGGGLVRLLSISVIDITDDEGSPPFGDDADEPYITVNGTQVWSGSMRNGDPVNQLGASAAFSGANAQVQLWELDPGVLNRPDDYLGNFYAQYTGGQPRTSTLVGNGGEYRITYEVVR